MFDKILVPLDGSTAAEMVVPYAGMMATKFGSQIILVSVSETGSYDLDRLYQTYLENIKEQIRHRYIETSIHKGATVTCKVLVGKPAKEILICADENNVGLIAMTSRGSSDQGPWLLGNIAAKVLRATTKPLFIVRAPASKIIHNRKLISKILVPLDGSDLGATALPYAEILGRELDAELVLFQALEPVDYKWLSEPHTFYAVCPDQTERKCYAMNYLDKAGIPLKEKGLKYSCEVAWGSPPEQILDYAANNSIDLIAISTHGRSGLSRWVIGSVTDKVLHAGETAVLVVQAH